MITTATPPARKAAPVKLSEVLDALSPSTWRFAGEDVNADIVLLKASADDTKSILREDTIERAIASLPQVHDFSDLESKRTEVGRNRYAACRSAIDLLQGWIKIIDNAEVALRARLSELSSTVAKETEKSRKALNKAKLGAKDDPQYAGAPQAVERRFEARVRETSNVRQAIADENDCKNELNALPRQRRKAGEGLALANRYLAEFQHRFISSAAR